MAPGDPVQRNTKKIKKKPAKNDKSKDMKNVYKKPKKKIHIYK